MHWQLLLDLITEIWSNSWAEKNLHVVCYRISKGMINYITLQA